MALMLLPLLPVGQLLKGAPVPVGTLTPTCVPPLYSFVPEPCILTDLLP
jgi:hypothetical protein